MILDSLNNLSKYIDAESFNIILLHLEKLKSGEEELNSWKVFDEDSNLKAIALNNSGDHDALKEYHKIYTDIHITIQGTDVMFIGNEISETQEEYDESKDYGLVKSPTVSSATLLKDNFALIKPNILHCNILDKPNSLKLVVKIKNLCPK